MSDDPQAPGPAPGPDRPEPATRTDLYRVAAFLREVHRMLHPAGRVPDGTYRLPPWIAPPLPPTGVPGTAAPGGGGRAAAWTQVQGPPQPAVRPAPPTPWVEPAVRAPSTDTGTPRRPDAPAPKPGLAATAQDAPAVLPPRAPQRPADPPTAPVPPATPAAPPDAPVSPRTAARRTQATATAPVSPAEPVVLPAADGRPAPVRPVTGDRPGVVAPPRGSDVPPGLAPIVPAHPAPPEPHPAGPVRRPAAASVPAAPATPRAVTPATTPVTSRGATGRVPAEPGASRGSRAADVVVPGLDLPGWEPPGEPDEPAGPGPTADPASFAPDVEEQASTGPEALGPSAPAVPAPPALRGPRRPLSEHGPDRLPAVIAGRAQTELERRFLDRTLRRSR